MSTTSLVVQIFIKRKWQDYHDVSDIKHYNEELRNKFFENVKSKYKKCRLIERIIHVEELILKS